MNNDMLAAGKYILSQQPFSVLLGAELTQFSMDVVEITLPLRQTLLQQFGFAHGGALSYLADNALTFAGGTALGEAILTSGYTINYIRPAKGETLVARAKVISAGSRQAVCGCEIFAVKDGIETLCAVAQGTIMTRSDPK